MIFEIQNREMCEICCEKFENYDFCGIYNDEMCEIRCKKFRNNDFCVILHNKF